MVRQEAHNQEGEEGQIFQLGPEFLLREQVSWVGPDHPGQKQHLYCDDDRRDQYHHGGYADVEPLHSFTFDLDMELEAL
uniref:Uncharacterized protein n=1 Tax=Anguilla anguilla TaxID=7936 RepID=A0A0E9XHY4_ANGAN